MNAARRAPDDGTQDGYADVLAHVLLESLLADAECVRRLAQAIAAAGPPQPGGEPLAYTVEGLAEVVRISPRAVRNAITRGELEAVKRGGRWLISHDHAEAWAHGDGPPVEVRRLEGRRVVAAPRRSPLRDALVRLDWA